MATGNIELAFLRDNLPFCDKVTKEQIRQLEESVTVLFLSKGEILPSGSADCSGLFLVKSGQVRAFILSESGKEITLYRLFERDICIFSASCIMRNISFDIHLQAEEDCKILVIPTLIYERLNKNSLAVSDFTNQLMSSRFSDVMWLMEQILFMRFDRRLALFIIEQSAIEGSDTIIITHETIARHMGSAREVVSRMLNYFQNEGIVSLSRSMITILDRKKLEKLATTF